MRPIIYLMDGGRDVLFIPTWAAIAFYPGFFVARQAYGWSYSERLGQTIGVIAVSLTYGLAAWLLYALITHFKRPTGA
jgi:hypothetical protein